MPSSVKSVRREDALHQFETGRIKHLQEERMHIQKKTFTKWMNSFLIKARLEVKDLFTDLADGKMLLRLLEIISGEKLGKPNNGRMRVHKVENVNKSLAFLHTKVRLESIGAEDIVDGNPRLILGLIWTIILRFQIQEIEIKLDEENESSEKKSAKDALLLWCQRKTAGYRGVEIRDFSGSWRNGLGFNALIHAHRPDLIDYPNLKSDQHIDNLNNAFMVAHDSLGVARILDAEDIDMNKPDEKSIITYVASYYHTFARMRDEMKGGRRIANIVKQMKGVDDSKDQYEVIISSLLEWIRMKIVQLDDREFPNTLDGIQKLLIHFGKYRTEEKPPKYIERSEIEALIFSINARLKELNQPSFCPKDGHNLHDLQKAWQNLEKAEHRREVALREELLRQERLQQLAYKFERKSVLRRGYLDEMVKVLSDPRYGSSLAQVHATVKKHEAISADILARQERFKDLTKMADDLDAENFHNKAAIREKERSIIEQWQALLDLLHRHADSLKRSSDLMSVMREVETLHNTVRDLEANFRSTDVGAHLLAVEDLLQKHSLMESQVHSCGDTIGRLNKQATAGFPKDMKDINLLKSALAELDTTYEGVKQLAKKRRARLEEARNLFQFLADTEEEEAWVIEKQRICNTAVTAKDLRAVMSLLQKHKTLEDEVRARRPRAVKIEQCGRDLVKDQHSDSKMITQHVDALAKSWKELDRMLADRRKQLQDASETYTFYADANEAESWIKEKQPLVESTDFGEDEPSGLALLQRHARLEEEVHAYKGDIAALESQGEKLKAAGITVLSLNTQPNPQQQPDQSEIGAEEDEFEWVDEIQLVPEEVVEEVPHEYIQEKYVTQIKPMQTVKAKYQFDGQGMKMTKGEEMFLIAKTNADWWNVRKVTGEDGFVPANYVREGEFRDLPVKVKQLEKKQEMRREVKKVLTKKVVPVKRRKPRLQQRSKPRVVEESSTETVEERLSAIGLSYASLLEAAQRRRLLLQDAIALFAFYSECSGFDQWMRDKEKMLKEDESATEGVEAAKRKFEKFLTDLSAASKRIENIDAMVNQFSKSGHSQLGKIKARQKQIHDHWDHLERLKQQKERSLEGASSVELFNRTCQETKDWMVEKMAKMDTDELGRDLKTIQSLQRKHDQLERELAPVEEKVNHVKMLGNSVKSSYPSERGMVDAQMTEVDGIWQRVRDSAGDRRNRLQEAVGKQIFFNSAKGLLSWVSGIKVSLNSNDSATDVTTAELLLKAHQDLGDDIRAHEDEFKEIQLLGEKLGATGDVAEMMEELREEQLAIQRGWQQKEDWLRQCLDLQLFNREADQIDVATSGHEAFLDYADMGNTLDGVEALLKRHGELESTLVAQNERLAGFSDTADKLIEANHYEADKINDRRCQVVKRRDAVKAKADERRMMFQNSLAYQQFKADADDFAKWMAEKQKLADDESYKDLNNLERKLQKHEAFQRELHSNEGQLRVLNKTGQDLIASDHYRKDDIAATLDELNKSWQKVCRDTSERGRKLKQANDQHNYNKDLEEAGKTLDSLEAQLKNTDVGSDLRSCKMLINKQTNIDNDLNNMEKKINDMEGQGKRMANDKHFDADNILKNCDQLNKRFQQLKSPAASRRAALDESLKFYQFWFQVDAEKQWINEHMPLATSQVVGQDLHEAQKLQKKHHKLEAELEGHQPMIDKTIQQGAEYVKERHPQAQKIESLCSDLSSNWKELCSSASQRQHILELSLKAQQYFFEANEIESWMAEKRNLLTTTDYGRDEDVARKLLAKHKAVELEIDSYSGLVKEMGTTADGLIKTNHPQSKLIKERQQLVNHELKELQRLSAQLRTKLMESMYRHEYMREAEQLETWVQEQMLTATSQDFGQDYEHLLILQNKFLDFKHRVEAGSERFNQCEELARKLVANESPYTNEIETNQEQLKPEDETDGESDHRKEVTKYHKVVKAAWIALLEAIESRDTKLDAAAEIHRFNRDVSDALARIQEKDKMISDDLGRDVHSVQALLRKHEGFENDLVALEAQLQVLVDDCARLQCDYPGPNSSNLAAQQEQVVQQWEGLRARAAARKMALQQSAKLHAFLAQSRDLLSWSCDLRSSMKAQEKVRDAASAQALKTEHDRLKLEIEAREDVFSAVVEDGNNMVAEKHYATAEVEERVTKVLEERSQLHAAWQHKKIYLDQLIDLQFFLRDAKHLDACSSAQEAALAIAEAPSTIHQVQNMKKKHDAFEKLVEAQDEKLDSLRLHGAKLVEQNHFHSPNIKSRIEEVAERRSKVKQATKVHKKKLDDAYLYAQFIRDVNDANSWISEKDNHLEAERQKGEVNSFQDKVKKLQKHQAFMAELQAHEPMMKEITEKGETLIRQRHASSPEVKQQVDELVERWTGLNMMAENHSRGLEEAQDILAFNTQVEKVDAWIRDKMLLVQAHDLGRDHEHCTALMRKLDDVDSDMRVDDTRFVNINRLADKIISQGNGDNNIVMQRRNDLNQKWSALKGALDQYRSDLEGALEMHAFNRDVTDTTERIVEKAALLSSEDTGRDLYQVEGLRRKQDNILRDMSAIEKKIKEHEREARRLERKYPAQRDEVNDKFNEVQQAWERLCEASQARDGALGASLTLHKFQSELRELEKWSESLVSAMNAAPLPTNTTEATELLLTHQEKKAEIDGRRDAFKALRLFAERLIQEQHKDRDTIKESLDTLNTVQEKVVSVWQTRQGRLTEANQLQVFLSLATLASDWLADQEAFLNNHDLGDSLGSVEALMRKHVSFENSFEAQGSKVDQLEKLGKTLVSSNHYDSDGIRGKLAEITEKRDQLLKASKLRSEKLQMSRALQQFLRNVYEVESWIGEKLQIACDESYTDPSNLQSKKQKHQAFESEVQANSSRLEVVLSEGADLLSKKHYAVHEIQAQLDGLESLWQQLLDSSGLKRERLHQAYQALLFSRTLDDLDGWMDEVEAALQSEDHGKDLTSVHALINKNGKLMQDVAAHSVEIDQCQDVAKSFASDDHFMKEAIVERMEAVAKRYESLQEPLQIRQENLAAALLLQELLRDIDEELLWLHEKTPLATSDELGDSLTAVHNYLRKHQALEAEVTSHDPVVSSINSRAQQMIRSGHFASEDISSRTDHLTKSLRQLKDAASVRKLRLLDAQEVQTFYSAVNEAEGHLREKRPLVLSQEYGRDEDSTQILIKKLDNLTRDIKSFHSTIEKLDATANKLVERSHYDSENVAKTMSLMRREHNEVEMLCEQRSRRLQQSLQLYTFQRRADLLLEHLTEQMTVAASEDYGRDVEHVELLIQKFESFLTALASNEHKINDISTEADKLLEDKHPDPERIKEKLGEVEQLWEDLRELASARQEALAGAKQVHAFDRDADETIRWIMEKDAVISSEDYGLDLETIQSLARKHQGFERDLAAVREQVETVVGEAKRLAELFPDAREHISVKHMETVEVWNSLLEKSALRKDKLFQREKLQSYFGDHADLLAWIIEMRAKVTAPDLPKDVPAAEAVIARHDEYKLEIDSRADAVEQFSKAGNTLIDQGHFMAEEIADKIVTLQENWNSLLDCWKRRDDIYQRNLDLRVFLRDAATIEAWIESSEGAVRDEDLGQSIEEVEELIRRHSDFIKTMEAQEDKFNPVKRITKIEADFDLVKKQDEAALKDKKSRQEVERMEAMKRREVHRITEERRREDERRRTQEIKFTKEDMEAVRLKLNGDYSGEGGQGGFDEDQTSGSSVSSYSPSSSRRGSAPGPVPLLYPRGTFLSFNAKQNRADQQEADNLQRSGSYTSLSSLKRGNSMRADLYKTTLTVAAANKGGLTLSGDLKRAESMKIDPNAAAKKPKRTPSFTTRRRTQSFRKHKQKAGAEQLDNLPPVELRGYLERKQELQTGGKKATMRSWKFFYTVLCGQLMCFFKDEEDFCEQKAASPPINILQASVRPAPEYTKKKNVFRLITRDNAEYLLVAETETGMQDWINKIGFHAKLPPSMQLLSYDIHKDLNSASDRQGGSYVSTVENTIGASSGGGNDRSSYNNSHSTLNTSRDSEPNSSGRSTPVQAQTSSEQHAYHRGSVGSSSSGGGGRLDLNRPPSQSLDNPLYANLEHIQPDGSVGRPPVPPRVAPPRVAPPPQHAGDGGPIYQNKMTVTSNYEVSSSGPEVYSSNQQQWSARHSYPANGVRRNSTDNSTPAGDGAPGVGSMGRPGPPAPPSRSRFLPGTSPPSQHGWNGQHYPSSPQRAPPPFPPGQYANQYPSQPKPSSPIKQIPQTFYHTPPPHYQNTQQQRLPPQQHYQQQQQQQQYYHSSTMSSNNSVGGLVDGKQQQHVAQVTRVSHHHYKGTSLDGVDGVAGSRQPISALERRSTSTLPAQTGAAAVAMRHSASAALDAQYQRRSSDESSDSGETSGDPNGNKANKRGSRSVFRFFNRRKGAQV